MKGVTPTEFQRLVAAEFGRQGWEYDLTIGRDLVATVQGRNTIDGNEIAKAVSSTFLERNGASRQDVAAAIERAVGGLTLDRASVTATLVIADNRYQVNLGSGAQISGSNLNVGEGTQIEVSSDADRKAILGAVEAIVRAGLVGSWSPDAAGALATLIEERSDIALDDVRKITAEVVRAEMPSQGRVAEFLRDIAAGGLGGALGTGISAGLGELISQLPL